MTEKVEKLEKIKMIEKALNVNATGVVEYDAIRKYRIVFNNKEDDPATYIDGNVVYINTYSKALTECLFQFWKLVGQQVPDVEKGRAKCTRWLKDSGHKIEDDELRSKIINELITDKFAMEHIDITYVNVDKLIPIMTISKILSAKNEDDACTALKDENAIIMARRDYLLSMKEKAISDAKNAEKKKGEKLPIGNGGLNLEKKQRPSSPIVNICRKLEIKVSDKDNFETCTKKIIKIFSSEDIESGYFTKVKHETLVNLYDRMRPIVENIVVKYFNQYRFEVSMHKRGPLRDLIISVLSQAAFGEATIDKIDVNESYRSIILDQGTNDQIKQKCIGLHTSAEWAEIRKEQEANIRRSRNRNKEVVNE